MVNAFDGLGQSLNHIVLTPVVAGLVLGAGLLGALMAAESIRWIIDRTIGGFFRQPLRKDIRSALEGADKSVSSLVDELTKYKVALNRLLEAYKSNPDNFRESLAAFKAVSARMSLQKVDSNKVYGILHKTYFHGNPSLYYGIYHKLDVLVAFYNSYREFFAEVNLSRLDSIADLVESHYHSDATVKPNFDYLLQKTTRKDAHDAIRYFELFRPFTEKCLKTAEDLRRDLARAIASNKFNKFIAALQS